jgi:hypothetical protein
MARPIVIVYQEVTNTSVTPITPDLQTIIVGPAYVINDYPDDAANILLPTGYGTAGGAAQTAGSATVYQPPVQNVIQQTVNAFPNNAPGAIVDQSSVALWLQTPSVILGSTTANSGIGGTIYAPSLGTSVTTVNSSSSLNLIQFTGGISLAATFGVQAGDLIYLTDSAGNTLKRTVLSVGEGGSALYDLRVTQNLPSSGWVFDANGSARIERVLATQLAPNPNGTILQFPNPAANPMNIMGFIQVSVSIAGTPTLLTVSYAGLYLVYTALRQDLQTINSCNFTQITTLVGKIDARNPLAVGLSVALQNSGSAPMLFYGVASDDLAGYALFRDAVNARKDLYAVVPLIADTSTLLGFSIDNTNLADPTQAAATGVVQKFRMVLGSGTLPTDQITAAGSTDGVPHQSGASSGKYQTINILEPGGSDISTSLPGDLVTIGLVPTTGPDIGTWTTRRGVHQISHVNTTTQFEILPSNPASWNNTAGDTTGIGGGEPGAEIMITDPTGYTVKFKKIATLSITYGSSTLLISHRVPVTSGGPYQVAFVGGAGTLNVTLSGFNITVNFVTASSTVSQVIAALQANAAINAVITTTLTGPGTDHVTASSLTPLAIDDLTGCGVSVVINDNYYDILEDDTATFLTDGVLPGDIVQIPANPNNYSNSAFTGLITSYVVTNVISENRVELTPATDDLPSVATEFPHGYSRSGSGLVDVTTPTAIRYQIVRVLNATAQVTALQEYAQSFMNARATLVWPDLCLVSGLVDGSLPRTSPAVPAVAGNQPGYYAACAVGGAMAGLPAQQGLTNIAFAGLTSVTHSTDYFTDPQISQISDGGWFVLQQDNPIAAPYCVHQLTTNPSAVETGEISVVKDIDFVSLYLVNVLDPFIGQYNVTEDTLTEINQALVQAMEQLVIRKVARIGAPLISGSVTSLAVSPVSSDQVDIYLDLDVPRPLNRIGLHLVV